MATTMKFVLDADDKTASSSFARFARAVEGATVATEDNSAALKVQSKTAEVSARAVLSLAKSDKILRDAERELAVADGRLTRSQAEQAAAADEARRQLEKEARAAEVAAIKLRLSGKAAGEAAGAQGFSALLSPMGGAVAAGVALAPILVTVGAGLGGLGLAALGASKDTKSMAAILKPLKGDVAAFQLALKPEVLRLFGDGAGIARQGLHSLEPVAAATGRALHGVLGDVSAEFRSGEWRQFFTFMAQQAGPDVRLLGKNLTDMLRVLPQLLTALQPAGTELLQFTDATLRLVGGIEHLNTAVNNMGDSSKKGASGLGTFIDVVKRAAIHALPGVDAAELFGKGLGAISSQAPGTAAAVAQVTTQLRVVHPVLGTLSGDMALLNIAITSGNVVLAAYSDEWDKFVGKSVGNQQAVLNMRQAFESFDQAVKSSGRTSTAAQQAFLAIFTTIGSGLDALHKNGASVQQLNSFYQASIDKLNALHGLTPAQRADVQGLTRDYIAWANVTHGLSAATVNAAGALRNTLLAQLANGHRLVPQVSGDLTAFSDAVLKTGSRSAATAADRAALIRDLRQSGFSAQAAKSLVQSFQGQIDALHGKTVSVAVTATGSGGVSVAAQGLAARIFKLSHLAGGGIVPGGYSLADNHLAMLRSGEGVLQPGAVAALGGPSFINSANARFGDVPVAHFAAGGVAGLPPWVAGQEGSVIGGWAGTDVASMLGAMIAKYKASIPAGFLGPGSGNYAADIATVLRAMGLPLTLVGNWLSQIQTESGGNLGAVNLTDSNAAAGHPSVGLLQLIPGTFAAYAGPYLRTPPLVNFGGGFVSENPMAQIYAAIHYAAARYGGAAMAGVIGHGHGYAAGTLSAAPGWGWVGERGPELIRFRGGEQVRPAVGGSTYNITVNVPVGAHPAQAGSEVVKAIREYERVNGSGWRS